jgi:hypothetical protein
MPKHNHPAKGPKKPSKPTPELLGDGPVHRIAVRNHFERDNRSDEAKAKLDAKGKYRGE